MSHKRSREEESSWCTIESDPGIFTLLIEKLGVKGVQVEEIYDFETGSSLSEIFGFIFLFKWTKEPEESKEIELNYDETDNVFFAQQEITNACATQAILHILLNLEESKVELGEVLNNFKSFAQELPADMRGLCISNSLEIRQIHNEFGNLEEYLAYGDENNNEDLDEKSKDPFHFVAFIRKNGKIYELDGLQKLPIVHGEVGASEWQGRVLEIVKKKLDASEIRFNLMAVGADRRDSLKTEIAELTAKIEGPDVEEKSSWLSRRFKLQQDFEDEEAKWSRYRKDWSDRQKRHHEMNRPAAGNSAILSSQVQDLLKSMSAKGLIPK